MEKERQLVVAFCVMVLTQQMLRGAALAVLKPSQPPGVVARAVTTVFRLRPIGRASAVRLPGL